MIVASASALLSLVLFGRVIGADIDGGVRAVAAGIAVASLLAAVLAYYSIQIGCLLIFGPVRISQVFAAFVVTGTQLSLFLWPSHVMALAANPETLPDGSALLGALRHWLLLYASFALTAALANADAALSRWWHRERLAPELRFYAKAQRSDRRAATASGLIALFFWLLSYKWLGLALSIGLALTILASAVGLASQARVAAQIRKILLTP